MTEPTAHAPLPFTQEADLVRLLYTLPESLLLATIDDRVACSDLAWLARMMNAGFFNAQVPVNAAGVTPQSAQPLYNQWASRCQAMLGVMGQARLVHPDSDATGYSSNHPLLRANFSMQEAHKDFFAGFCQTIGEQMKGWQNMPINLLSIDMLMAQTMGLAAMLDRPEVLTRLAQSFPSAVNEVFDEQALGNGMFSKVFDRQIRMEVAPLFCALQFSGPACVEALLPWFSKDTGLCITQSEENDSLWALKTLASFQSMCHRSQVASMTPLIRLMVEQSRNASDREKKELKAAFFRLLPGTDQNSRMLNAFVDAGAADLDPTASMAAAVKLNRPYVLEHFRRRIDWDAFVAAPTQCLEAFTHAINRSTTKGLSWLIAQAKDSGHGKQFLDAFVLDADGHVMNDAAKALMSTKAGAVVLPHVLELGLSADALTNDGVTLKDVADKFNWGARDVLNSFAARAQARALIDEIDSESAAKISSASVKP